ncbi:hypothetical protein V5O48_005104 [Marasmius crinis-equi]|uniref:Uncharacterized protein n=1 Tax=Marasmius crinis-equi TaxID=585013 RepID=A0ABR3FNY3_9AGAR
MAYHNSFQGRLSLCSLRKSRPDFFHSDTLGYSNANEPHSGNGSNSSSFKHGGVHGQDRSSGDCDAPADGPFASATVPRNNNSNHVTPHNATNHTNLANHFGNLSAAASIHDDKTHLPILPPLHFPSVPSLLPSSSSSQSQTQTRSSFDAMQNSYHHIGPAHDDRSYQQYPISFSYGAASLPVMPEPSTSQHKLPGRYGTNPFYDFTSHYGDTRYDGGAMLQETSELSTVGDDDDDDDIEIISEGYGLGGEGYESSDMELDSDAYHQPSAVPSEDPHAFIQFQAPTSSDPPQTQSCFKLTSCEYEPEWYPCDISPEGNGFTCPWSAGKQSDSLEPPWSQVQTVHPGNSLRYHPDHPVVASSLYSGCSEPFKQGQGDIASYSDSSPHCDYDARNTTPSDISSSASPLSPIDGLTYPASHFVPASFSIPTQAPYSHSMSGIAYPSNAGYDPTVPVKSDETSEVASTPFIAAFLNGNGLVNSSSVPITNSQPILHAPRPVRPIPTVSFEDLAASILDVSKA